MLNATLSDEIRGWKWVAHSVIEGALIVAVFFLAVGGPLTLFFVNSGGPAILSQDFVAEMAGG